MTCRRATKPGFRVHRGGPASPMDVHVYRDSRHRGWVVRSVHSTQDEAIRTGVRIARRLRVDVVTHGRDGRIRSKDSYGNETKVKDTEH